MSTETEKQVSDYLQSIGVNFAATHTGLAKDENKWIHDTWRIELSRGDTIIATDYRTGYGHRRNKAGKAPESMPNFIHFEDCKKWLNGQLQAHQNKGPYFAKAPAAAGVIDSLFRDGEAAIVSFHSWCDELGFDSDSISALNTYKACEQIGLKLRKLFKTEESEALRVMLEDY